MSKTREWPERRPRHVVEALRRATLALVLGAVGLGGCSKKASLSIGGGDKASAAAANGAGTAVFLCAPVEAGSDVSVSVSTSPGSETPNVRRVYRAVAVDGETRQVLVCREVDSNLDGRSDVVRFFDDQGQALREESDANYDGRMDTWVEFVEGKPSKVSRDTTRSGRPDETRFYVRGVLRRAERDTNGDQRADVFEIYRDGVIQRIGVDVDFDGAVDRWDTDRVAAELAKRAEREAEAKEAPSEPPAAPEPAKRKR